MLSAWFCSSVAILFHLTNSDAGQQLNLEVQTTQLKLQIILLPDARSVLKLEGPRPDFSLFKASLTIPKKHFLEQIKNYHHFE